MNLCDDKKFIFFIFVFWKNSFNFLTSQFTFMGSHFIYSFAFWLFLYVSFLNIFLIAFYLKKLTCVAVIKLIVIGLNGMFG